MNARFNLTAGLTEGPILHGWGVILISILVAPAVLAENPPDEAIQAHYQRAQEALRQNRQDEAASEFLKIIHLNPKLAEAHANLGVVYYTQAKYSEAAQEFREALKLKPSLSRAQSFLGMSEAKSGHIQEAIPHLEAAFRNSTDDEWRQQTGLLLVELYSARMEMDKALDVIRSLQKSYPSNPEVLYIAYRIYSDLGAKAVSGLVKAAPESVRLHQLTAELLESEGDYARAIEQYRKAAEIDPKLPGIHRALGIAILSLAKDEASTAEAQKQFELELAANPTDAHSEYQLGEIYWGKYEYEEALNHFTRAVELRPNFVDALIALGKVLISKGQSEKALVYLGEALRTDPENEVAHYRLAQAYRKLGKTKQAEDELAMFRKLREASASIGAIYRQVQRNPVIGQTVESQPNE
jgi:tetratricopeptide (TPR) repeat protein